MQVVADQISEVANKELLFVKDMAKKSEAKFCDKFDIYDPHSKELLVECREPQVAGWKRLSRLWGKPRTGGTGFDTMAPVNYIVSLPNDGPQILRIARGSSTLTIGGASVEFFNSEDDLICRTKIILLCIGRKYGFMSPSGQPLFMLQMTDDVGKTSILANGKEVASLTSNWTGDQSSFFKERFKYAISLSPELPADSILRNIVFAVGLCYYQLMECPAANRDWE